MLYDLSITWTPSTTAAELENTLAMSAELGYDVVALDHVYSGPVPAAVTNAIPVPVPAAAASATAAARRMPKVLRRATVVVADTTVNHRLAAVAAAYDLVAVRPTTEKAFQAACLNMAEPALISLDLTTYFPFFFKHRTVMAAVRRGVHFEVCYGQALRESAPPSGPNAGNGNAAANANRARALFIANLAGLLRATRGRGIVVSSGASARNGALELRGPADVVNLLAVWGLAPDRGTEALGALARSVVANEGLRRRGFRGVVDIVQTAGGDERDNADNGPGDRNKTGEKKAQKQKQKQSSSTGSKRKGDEASAEASPRPPGTGERQVKKLKKSGGR